MTKNSSQPPRTTTPRVFISSTVEDLEPHRAAAKEAALKVNILPVMCEDFAASDHQPPLEQCLARVKETDVLIVLSAHRYGWIPPDQTTGSPAKSITWLECEQAKKESLEVLPFLIGHDDSWPAEKKEDYRLNIALKNGTLTPELMSDVMNSVAGLKKFHQWLGKEKWRKKVQTPQELQTEIVLALQEWRKRHPDFESPAISPGQMITPEKYLRRLLVDNSYIVIRGLEVGSGKAHQFPIEDLYITLCSRQPLRESERNPDQSSRDPGADPAEKLALKSRFEKPIDLPLHAALTAPKLVIIGDPGAGKTTFLQRIAAALCLTELGDDPQAAQSRLGIPDRTFPMLIKCAKLAVHIKKHLPEPGHPSDPSAPVWLVHFLAAESRDQLTGLDQDFFGRQLDDGRCTVLFDGLDEASDLAQRATLSQLIEQVTQAFPRCRFVVSSRPPAYTGMAILPQFTQVEIAALTDEAIEQFLTHWCGALYVDQTPKALAHRQELMKSLHAKPEIRRLARNPVMLTALAVVQWNQKTIPEQRAELYESVISWLSKSRETRPGRETPERCLTLLRDLALAMQDHAEGRRIQVSKRWAAEKVLAKHFTFGVEPVTSASIAQAETFLTAEELDSGIVVAAGTDIKFWHLQFQEYLAARAIAGKPEADQERILFGADGRLYRPEWREVILLLAGALHEQGVDKVDWFVKKVLDQLPSAESTAEDAEPLLAVEARCAGLLGGVFHDLQPTGYQSKNPQYLQLLKRVMSIFDRQGSKQVEVGVRIAAAEALGQVGDPRLKPTAPDRWVTIRSKPFLMGSQKLDPSAPNFDDEADDDEMPAHTVKLSEFAIGRFPVTVGEFQLFVDHGGYDSEPFWKHGGFGQFTAPEDWQSQLPFLNRPVVGVSWLEAMAYCEFAKVQLPTEAQWERAARGTTGRKYPWGNQRADKTKLNFNGNIDKPTPVGIYPLGTTPDGIVDLGGNVWEWCADWFGAYESQPSQDPSGAQTGEFRVVRGGSWNNFSRDARSAIRDRDRPDIRNFYVGFRVVALRQDS